MSKGKYSPALTFEQCQRPYSAYCYNAYKQLPPTDWEQDEYDDLIHFDNYDDEGYDSYGYSAWLADGKFAGHGLGVDRWGYTEMDYLGMSDDEFEDICRYGG